MAYFFVIAVGFLGIAVYLTLMYSSIPGAVDERLGKLEELPANLGEWVEETETEAAEEAAARGEVIELRFLHHPKSGLFDREYIAKQVRYRDAETRKILRVAPEEKVVRRRRKA